MRAAARGPLQVMFPMVTTVEDWDAAMRVVERCREHLRERGVPFKDCLLYTSRDPAQVPQCGR